MNIIERLNARVERKKRSDRVVAKVTRTTTAKLDRNTTRADPGRDR